MAGLFISPQKSTRYLFIDGGYLRKRVEELSVALFGGDPADLDLAKLSHGYRKTFYYDAPPAKGHKEDEKVFEQRLQERCDYFEKLSSLPAFHVFLGRSVGKGKTSRQKGVDVLIAVHMLNHAARRNADEMTLLAGDADFKPLVEALVQDGVDVTILYDERSASKEFIRAADRQTLLTPEMIHHCCTSDFHSKWPVPVRNTFSGRPSMTAFSAVRSGTTRKGASVALYVSEKEAALVEDAEDGRCVYYTHPDATFLDKWFIHCVEPITWT